MTNKEPAARACGDSFLRSAPAPRESAGSLIRETPGSWLCPSGKYAIGRFFKALLIPLWALAWTAGGQPSAADSDPRLSEAAQLIEQGAVSEAISRLEVVVETRPRDVDALLMLGSALSLVPRRNEAVHVLLRALALSPDEARVHASAGTAFGRLGEQDAALKVFERALSLDPKLGDAHLNVALIRAAREQFDRAAEHMARALSLEADSGNLARLHFLNGKLHVERNRLEEAGQEFERSIALDSRNAGAHLALGLTRQRLLREDEAYPMFRKAVELAPEDPTARYHLALELQRRGDYDAAAEHFRQAHEHQPDDRSIVYNLTRALHKAGRASESLRFRGMLAEMIESSDRARENEFETARLHGEAVRLEEAGNYVEALDKYRAVLRIEPLNTVSRRNLALVLCRLGRWNEGIEELQAILRSDPDDAETARTLTIVLDEARRSGTLPPP